MLFSSWLSTLSRLSPLRSRRHRRKCLIDVAACVEIFEDKALLSGYASADTLWLPHSTPGFTQSATTTVIYMDYDGPASAVITTAPTKGTAIDNADGTFTYTANTNQVGSDSFAYAMTDRDGVTHNATVNITLGNSDAYAYSDNAWLPHSTPTMTQTWSSANLYGDMDGDTVTVTITTSPTKGTVVNNGDGTFTYTANSNQVGADSFAFSVTDSLPGTTVNTGTVNITLGNTYAYANSDNASLPHSTPTMTQTWTSGNLYGDMDGDTVTVTITSSPTKGSVVDNGDGSFTYTANNVYQIGPDSFAFSVTDSLFGTTVGTGTVSINVTNATPSASDDDFDYPEPGVQYVDIDVLANDWDMDDDHADLVITSVSTPTFGGSASIVGNKIRFYPPADYYSNSNPEENVFSLGTEFTYTVADPVALADPFAQVGQGTVRAASKKWTPWAEYSRGNDDPNEKIYETGVIKIELIIDDATKKVSLRYTATATTDSRLRAGPNGPEIVLPGDADQGVPEYEFFKDYLFLQKAAKTVGDPIPGGGDGVKLTFTPGGVGGSLSGEIELGTWGTADISGTAVIQMQAGGQYQIVRQQIAWSVTVAEKNGQYESKRAALGLAEVALPPAAGRVPSPLRIIDASNGEGDVFKLGYPSRANGLDRKADNPTTSADERADPLTPPADWNLKVKAKTK